MVGTLIFVYCGIGELVYVYGKTKDGHCPGVYFGIFYVCVLPRTTTSYGLRVGRLVTIIGLTGGLFRRLFGLTSLGQRVCVGGFYTIMGSI